MTIRTDITDLTGTPRALADLTGEEMRALRALAGAGMIAPLAAAAPTGTAEQGATEQSAAKQSAVPARTARTKNAPAGTGPRSGGTRTGRKQSQEVQGTLMAA